MQLAPPLLCLTIKAALAADFSDIRCVRMLGNLCAYLASEVPAAFKSEFAAANANGESLTGAAQAAEREPQQNMCLAGQQHTPWHFFSVALVAESVLAVVNLLLPLCYAMRVCLHCLRSSASWTPSPYVRVGACLVASHLRPELRSAEEVSLAYLNHQLQTVKYSCSALKNCAAPQSQRSAILFAVHHQQLDAACWRSS